MLGVVLMQRMHYREALGELLAVARDSAWSIPGIRRNLGLCLGHLLRDEAKEELPRLLAQFVVWDHQPGAAPASRDPLVSIVLPSYNHARFVGAALDSIAAQSYRNFELIVIDDGSSDGSPQIIEAKLRSANYPHHFLARENRGAPQTLNEGATLSRGEFLAFLNSDDLYTPVRLERLVAGIAAAGKDWGFSKVVFIDEAGACKGRAQEFSEAYQVQYRKLLGSLSNSLTFVSYSLAVSTGNLFLRRSFFEALGGFHDFRYNHDWDLCLRASRAAEPMILGEELYRYRVHGANTISESRLAPKAEADHIFSLAVRAMSQAKDGAVNPFSAWAPENRKIWLQAALVNGLGEVIAPEFLDELAEEILGSNSLQR